MQTNKPPAGGTRGAYRKRMGTVTSGYVLLRWGMPDVLSSTGVSSDPMDGVIGTNGGVLLKTGCQ